MTFTEAIEQGLGRAANDPRGVGQTVRVHHRHWRSDVDGVGRLTDDALGRIRPRLTMPRRPTGRYSMATEAIEELEHDIVRDA